jgi:hypothetical protein
MPTLTEDDVAVAEMSKSESHVWPGNADVDLLALCVLAEIDTNIPFLGLLCG